MISDPSGLSDALLGRVSVDNLTGSLLVSLVVCWSVAAALCSLEVKRLGEAGA